MFKFFEFINNLFFKREKINVQDMQFLSTKVDKNGVETIIHGNEKAKIELKIKRGEGEGQVILKADKNVKVSQSDIIYLLKKYL